MSEIDYCHLRSRYIRSEIVIQKPIRIIKSVFQRGAEDSYFLSLQRLLNNPTETQTSISDSIQSPSALRLECSRCLHPGLRRQLQIARVDLREERRLLRVPGQQMDPPAGRSQPVGRKSATLGMCTWY